MLLLLGKHELREENDKTQQYRCAKNDTEAQRKSGFQASHMGVYVSIHADNNRSSIGDQ